MSADLEKIKERIRKLLNLAENDAAMGAEIDNAMQLAQQLMVSYNVSRDDLATEDQPGRVAYGQHAVYTTGINLTLWESALAVFLCELVGTTDRYYSARQIRRKDGIAVTKNGKAVTAGVLTFYGPDADAQFCVEMFEEISIAAASLAKLRWGSHSRGAGGSYCEGFVRGLSDANRRAIQQIQAHSESRALMVRSQQNALVLKLGAQDWLKKEQGIKLRKGSGRSGVGVGFSSQAYHEGVSDGKSYKLDAKPKPQQKRLT